MKQLIFITILYISLSTSFQSYAQQLTIGGIKGQTVFIGISNKINYHHPSYSRIRVTLMNDNCRFNNNTCYCSKEGKTTLLVSDSLNNPIDSFLLIVKRVEVFGLFLKLKDDSLIKLQKRISKEQIQQFKSLYLAHNVPWANFNIEAFDFTLVKNDEFFSFTIRKNYFPNELKMLLLKIEQGSTIYIDNIKIRTPGDDAHRQIRTITLEII